MSTSNCETPKIPTDLNKKAMMEKNRREEINTKISELRDLVFEDLGDKHISQAKVLQRAVEVLRGDSASTSPSASSPGTSSSSSSSPDLSSESSSIGPIRSRKEIRKHREQSRRDQQEFGYEALREYISANHLGQPERLDRSGILKIIIAEIRKMKSLLPSPSASPIFPFPIIPYPQLVIFNYLMWLQSLTPTEVSKTDEEDDNEYIDVVN